MNKVYLGIGVITLVLVTGLYFVASNSQPKQGLFNSTTPATSTNTEVTNSTSTSTISEEEIKYVEIDLAKLPSKDRLYTEEEGRFENLSEGEQSVVKELVCSDVYEFSWLCNELTESPYKELVSLVSLYNGTASIITPHSGAKGVLYIFDLSTKKILGRYVDTGNLAFGSNYIIRRGENYISDYKFDGWVLELYRPGMNDFVTIPNSKIELDLSYLKWTEMILWDFPITFSEDSITATVNRHDCDYSVISEFSGAPVYCDNVVVGTKTFNLSNLP